MALTGKELRYKVIELIEDGGATADNIIEACELKDKRALSRVFAELRIMERFPFEQSDGTYTLLSEEEYAEKEKAGKTATKKAKVIKNPTAMRARALAKYNRALVAAQKAADKAQAKTDDRLLTMKAQVAQMNFAIAKMELDQVKAELAAYFGMSVEDLNATSDLNSLAPASETEE